MNHRSGLCGGQNPSGRGCGTLRISDRSYPGNIHHDFSYIKTTMILLGDRDVLQCLSSFSRIRGLDVSATRLFRFSVLRLGLGGGIIR